MRIAFVYDGAYPWIKGGVEKRLHEIGKGLVKRGHEVHWYCVGWWLNENRNRDIEVDGINYHAVCGPMEMYVNGRRSIKAAIKFSLSLFRPLLRNKFDIIDCQQFPFFPCFISKLVSVIRGSIFIMTVHEYWGPYWYEYLGKIKGLFGRLIEKLTFKLTDNVITISNYVKSTLDFYNGKIYVVPDGVQFDRIRMLRKKGEKSNLIFVGRLIKHKNVDILLRAMDILKRRGFSFKCFIIGDGPEKKNLKKLSEELGLEYEVKFLGRVPSDDDVYRYMKSSDVFVFPSSREGAGIVTLEANAAGLPVITADHPLNASRELITSNNGILFDLTPEDLAEKIIFMMKNHEGMKEDCIKFAENYSWDNIVKLTENVYLEVLE